MFKYNDTEFIKTTKNNLPKNNMRLKAIEIKSDLYRRIENPFMLSKELKDFKFQSLIQIFKHHLFIQDENELLDTDILNCIRFIVEQINPVISMEIKHQLNKQIISIDDLTPVIINVFAGAFIGNNSININLFNLIEKSYIFKEYCGYDANISTSYQLFHHYKNMAHVAEQWLKDKKYIDTVISPFYNIKYQDSVSVKILLLGKSYSGKSSFINKYNNHSFNINKQNLTLGTDITIKKIPVNFLDKQIDVVIELWDTAGQEKYAPLNNTYLRNVDGVLFVYDISSKNFMESLLSTTNSDYDIKNTMEKYLTDMKKHFCINNELLDEVPYIFFGNKTDLIDRNFIKLLDSNLIKLFIHNNYKYNKYLDNKYRNKNIESYLTPKNIDNLIKYINYILNEGKCDKYYWGSVLNNYNIGFTIYNLVYSTLLNKFNVSEEYKTPTNTLTIQNNTNSKIHCCKTM